ncbi:Helix-turn-helix domain-containing protein [Jatrophihabitans endophyticus]|uniref:Helix-turn-helix domain-containing protein n=1 Tax=Jatrophihabitans endophyticus TaxID=1206085 RepID=A0A1M5EHW7_9ACTN|nr:helix-turn-helix domain-containing protein [Jatrophihabitans endophyticus]SHF78642.1 Helix-turn-helix domain-containing protein [Jatrophihabitans endophyticus]
MSYRETPAPAPLRPWVACLWQQRVTARRHLVVPDGCVDLIWFGGDRLLLAGADTGPVIEQLCPDDAVTGVRLRPQAAGAVLGRPANEVTDARLDARDVLGARADRLVETLRHAPEPRRHAVLLAEIARAGAPDPVVTEAVRLLARPAARVHAVAAAVGLSERQLHRRVTAAAGLSPKMLARVARLQRLTRLAVPDLADRARDAGYAGQSHMSDEVRRLTGLTAVRFLEDRGATGSLASPA